jgi:hypothetical protein
MHLCEPVSPSKFQFIGLALNLTKKFRNTLGDFKQGKRDKQSDTGTYPPHFALSLCILTNIVKDFGVCLVY